MKVSLVDGIPFRSKEISWLSFNSRVLQEAADERLPLQERLKFLGIYSSNLDEFFRVRVATLRRLIQLGRDYQKLKLFLHFNPTWINAVEIDAESVKKSLLDKAINDYKQGMPRENFVKYCVFLITRGVTAQPKNYFKLIEHNFVALFYFAWQATATNFMELEELKSEKQNIMNVLARQVSPQLCPETLENYKIHSKGADDSATKKEKLQVISENRKEIMHENEVALWKKQFRMSTGVLQFFPKKAPKELKTTPLYPAYSDYPDYQAYQALQRNSKKPPQESIEYECINLVTNQLTQRINKEKINEIKIK